MIVASCHSTGNGELTSADDDVDDTEEPLDACDLALLFSETSEESSAPQSDHSSQETEIPVNDRESTDAAQHSTPADVHAILTSSDPSEPKLTPKSPPKKSPEISSKKEDFQSIARRAKLIQRRSISLPTTASPGIKREEDVTQSKSSGVACSKDEAAVTMIREDGDASLPYPSDPGDSSGSSTAQEDRNLEESVEEQAHDDTTNVGTLQMPPQDAIEEKESNESETTIARTLERSISGRRLAEEESSEMNPKPSKRSRRPMRAVDLSFKYFKESICGFEDVMEDGFWDAGRWLAFKALEELEMEEVKPDRREVILVDRYRDEVLDGITKSAQQLLRQISGSGDCLLQRVTTLALFVSDFFGGSHHSFSIRSSRLSAIGYGTSSSVSEERRKKPEEVVGCTCFGQNGVLPSGRITPLLMSDPWALNNQLMPLLKSKLKSIVIPIGAVQYGVCRHRGILFKYLCDHVVPRVPCELVRGFLDCNLHVWNVVKIPNQEDSDKFTRLLVDVCSPLDIQPESDPHLQARYIPMRGVHVSNLVELQMLNGVKLLEEIGRGSSGAIVHRCTAGKMRLAAKVTKNLEWSESQQALHEMGVLRRLPHHPCLLKFYGHVMDQNENGLDYILLFELMEGGSLEDLIEHYKENHQGIIPVTTVAHIVHSVAQALSHIHSHGLIHRDVKSSNVLVGSKDASWDPNNPLPVKLCDLNATVSVWSSTRHSCSAVKFGPRPADSCIGTLNYMAPEVMRTIHGPQPYGTAADIWSFGCLVAELLTLSQPYGSLAQNDLEPSIQVGKRTHLPDHLLDLAASTSNGDECDDVAVIRALVVLYLDCTEMSPSKRPSASDVCARLAKLIDDYVKVNLEASNNDTLESQEVASSSKETVSDEINDGYDESSSSSVDAESSDHSAVTL